MSALPKFMRRPEVIKGMLASPDARKQIASMMIKQVRARAARLDAAQWPSSAVAGRGWAARWRMPAAAERLMRPPPRLAAGPVRAAPDAGLAAARAAGRHVPAAQAGG